MMNFSDTITTSQRIVRGSFNNIRENFSEVSGIYKFTNEDITSYYNHLQNKERVLSVIGSGQQILNCILAGTTNIDCFDISVFPQYYLFLQIASVLSLTKEEYIQYLISTDRNQSFCDELFDKVRENLKENYKKFWDSLYMFDDGIDIFDSLLFRQDVCNTNDIINRNPYLQDDNYNKLKHILKTRLIKINPIPLDVTKTKFHEKYDLVILSNILVYYFNNKQKYIDYLKNSFELTDNGEIINYFFALSEKDQKELLELLNANSYIEDINNKKLLVYKK